MQEIASQREKSQWGGGGGGGARLVYTHLTVCSIGPPPILCIWKLRSIAHVPSSKLSYLRFH